MKPTSIALLLIGIALFVVGVIMEFSAISLKGSFLKRGGHWFASDMGGKSVIFFGLVILLLRQYILWKKRA